MKGELSNGNGTLWQNLRRLTAARIGLRSTGASVATEPLLEFKLAHARARDAVHEALDIPRLRRDLETIGAETIEVQSAVDDRQRYLLRPDLGRRLSTEAEGKLAAQSAEYDVVFVVADGLSARAVQNHVQPMLEKLLSTLRSEAWRIAPTVMVRHGRVAIGDRIADLLGAKCVAILIGERPGLSAPDSMGAYLTWQPGPNTSDADRNCISNIRPGGIGYAEAAQKIAHLLRAMRAGRISGVALKDDSDRHSDRASIAAVPKPGEPA